MDLGFLMRIMGIFLKGILHREFLMGLERFKISNLNTKEIFLMESHMDMERFQM